MRRLVTGPKEVIAEFVAEGIGCGVAKGNFSAIGVVDDDGVLMAGVVYTDYNGRNITAAIHGIGKKWMTKEFLHAMFDYPFIQAGAERITATIETFNKSSHNLATRLGFTHEATLQRAGRYGDLHVYRMFREDCKWLNKECRNAGNPSETSLAR